MKLAQVIKVPGADLTGTPIDVTLEGPAEITDRFSDIGDVISKLIPVVLSIAGLLLFIMLIWGGYDFLFSGGDPGKVEAGRTKILNAVIGFVIVFVAYFLTQLLAYVFGFTLF